MIQVVPAFCDFWFHRVIMKCGDHGFRGLSGHALGIWICGCSLFYKREFWALKSAGAHSTKSLKISACTRCTCANAFPDSSKSKTPKWVQKFSKVHLLSLFSLNYDVFLPLKYHFQVYSYMLSEYFNTNHP